MHYKVLSKRLDSIMSSEPNCAGDGNGDLVVDQKDIDDYQKFVDGGGGSSVYDFNFDGMTNSDDEQVIVMNLNTDCRPDRR